MNVLTWPFIDRTIAYWREEHTSMWFVLQPMDQVLGVYDQDIVHPNKMCCAANTAPRDILTNTVDKYEAFVSVRILPKEHGKRLVPSNIPPALR